MSSGSDTSNYNQFRQGIYARGPFERRGTLPIIGPEADSFFVSSSDLGTSRTFDDSTKFKDREKFDPVMFIRASGSDIYPDIERSISPTGLGQFNGVIEPTNVRSSTSLLHDRSLIAGRGPAGSIGSGNESDDGSSDTVSQFFPVTPALVPVSSSVVIESQGYITSTYTSSFTYTATTQSFAVPADHTEMIVYAWGAGGGTGLWSSYYGGGAGGFTIARLNVSGGQTYLIIVGGSGSNVSGSAAGDGPDGGFGGGGYGTKGDASGGGGGGYSGIFTGSVTQSNAVVIAGGGGAGTGWAAGGGGGGLEGTAGATNGLSGIAGRGGTQSAGGENSTGGGTLGPPYRGSALQGGVPSGSQLVSSAEDGGGGGGGYFGGGGGGADATAGGGGSGFVTSSAISSSQEGGARGALDSYSLPSGSSYLSLFNAPALTGKGAILSSSGLAFPGGSGFVYIETYKYTSYVNYREIVTKTIPSKCGISPFVDYETNVTLPNVSSHNEGMVKQRNHVAPVDDVSSYKVDRYGVTYTGQENINVLNSMTASTDDMIPFGEKSAGAGFVYGGSTGTDSVAFGGLKR